MGRVMYVLPSVCLIVLKEAVVLWRRYTLYWVPF